jgi:protein-S-isoprenylcysteine O-methyltransferase Ste14
MGAFTAFLVALFTEMYGVPLTVYLLSSWLGSRFPALQATHSGGHLWNDLAGWDGDPHLSPFHLTGYLAIGGGFWLISAAWQVLWEATRTGRLATTGPYARIRHPQYTGFLLINDGVPAAMADHPDAGRFPALVWVYRRLATAEEREVAGRLGPAWTAWAARTPRFLPRLRLHLTAGSPPLAGRWTDRHAATEASGPSSRPARRRLEV